MASALVERRHLQAANSLISLSFTVARAIGPLAGAFLIASFGIGSPFLALCGLSLLAILFTMRIREPKREAPSDGTPWQKVREGFSYARENATVRWLLVLALFLLAAFTWLAVLPVYARDVLHVGEKGYGTMLATFAAGNGISGLYIALSGGFRRKGIAVVVSAVVWSMAAIVFGYSHSYPLSLAMMFVLGIVPPIWVSSLVTLLQISTPKDKVGRIMSLFALTVQIAQLSWLIGTALGEVIGNPAMIAITLGMFAGMNLLALIRSPQLRALT
jgi:predicted MFS family arabinose efflux permease